MLSGITVFRILRRYVSFAQAVRLRQHSLGLMGWGTRAERTKPNVSVDTRPLVQFVKDSSTANKTAAIWSAFAALAWAVSGIATFFN
jgi:hypothetical protein